MMMDRTIGPPFQQKLDSLAAVINQERPHVPALQEIGPNGALGHLQAALTHQMPHAIEGQPDRRGIRVAFLSTEQFQSTRLGFVTRSKRQPNIRFNADKAATGASLASKTPVVRFCRRNEVHAEKP